MERVKEERGKGTGWWRTKKFKKFVFCGDSSQQGTRGKNQVGQPYTPMVLSHTRKSSTPKKYVMIPSNTLWEAPANSVN